MPASVRAIPMLISSIDLASFANRALTRSFALRLASFYEVAIRQRPALLRTDGTEV